MKILYLTYDGLSDPLGQSQILPYIFKLNKEHDFDIISFEKQEKLVINKAGLQTKLDSEKINWHPETYHKSPPVLSTIWDLLVMYRKARKIHKSNPYTIVHCRSHLTALVGLRLKQRLGVKLLFDMRSFYPDERVDGRLWPQTNPIYKLIYKYFKSREVELFNNCDALVVLTHKAAQLIPNFDNVAISPDKITIIPCCADLDYFHPKSINKDVQQNIKAQLNIKDGQFIISYLGSIGSWYMIDEMLQLFKVIKSVRPESLFLFITPNSKEEIHSLAKANGVDTADVRCIFGEREKLPSILSLSDVGLFFILPTFSKKASSPTKHAELMGLGIPVICNAGVGDLDKIITETKTGYLVEELNETNYKKCALRIDDLQGIDKSMIMDHALKLFSLQSGVDKYNEIYHQILKN